MLQELDRLLAATALFVLGHFILSSRALRAPLIEKLGEGGFRTLYSLSMLGAMVWMIWSYRGAAFIEVWTPPEAGRLAALILMAFAAILVVGGLTQANPTAVGGEKLLAENGSAKAARGFSTISRHPFLCGTSLWALAHLASNGDAATMILTGGILVLSLGGMIHIDARRAASLGADWGPLLLTTSRLPFWAALTGRSKIDWRGIGLLRPLAGLALYALLLFGHQWIAGAALLSL